MQGAQQLHDPGTGAFSSQQHRSPSCSFLSFSKGLLGQCDRFGAFLCGQQPGFEEPWKMLKCFICFHKRLNNNNNKLFFQAPSEVVVNVMNFSSPHPPFCPNKTKISFQWERFTSFKKNFLLKQNCFDFLRRKQSLLICYLSNCFYMCLIILLSAT